jgi:hypothetical protein
MRIANSFFTKPNYATWKNFNTNNPSHHMLDVFSISKSIFKHVTNCETIPHGADHTDHTATAITIDISSIAFKPINKTTDAINGGRADWHRITYDDKTN